MALVHSRFSEAGSWNYSQVHPGPLSWCSTATVAGKRLEDATRPTTAQRRPVAVPESGEEEQHREIHGQCVTDHPGDVKASASGVSAKVDRVLPEQEWSLSNMKSGYPTSIIVAGHLPFCTGLCCITH